MKKQNASELIEARIEELGDWRGETLARVRALVKEADPEIVEGNTRRAIDLHEGDEFDEGALKELIRGAVALNTSASGK